MQTYGVRPDADADFHPELPTTMRAAVRRSYGTADAIEIATVDVPEPKDDQVLVRVVRASVNPLDWHFTTGLPLIARSSLGWRSPRDHVLGADLAGVVERVGANVTGLTPGTRVAGVGLGTFAEFALANPDRLAAIPDVVDDEDAAALPIAGVTALQAVRDRGSITTGQRVLVNGAAGGVGTFAVQLAVDAGAQVTGVCSARNVDMVRELGATEVIDYTHVDALATAGSGAAFDAIIDNVGNWPPAALKGLLREDGVAVVTSGPKRNRLYGPVGHMLRGKVRFVTGGRTFVPLFASVATEAMATLLDRVATERLTPQIERVDPLDAVPDAMRYLSTGHARAKVVIAVS
jgi:NADPH:quinone reductase-like Zn-dependent oxidoreductase